jgi:alpha-beta hydrolase superfamily lysophospholipase
MDIKSLLNNMRPLDLVAPADNSEKEKEYFRFYGINLEEHFDDVEHFFGNVRSTGYDIACHYFSNAAATKTCFIVHGYYDHSGLYAQIAEYCLQQNYSVVMFDLPGHGLSSGTESAIESFSHYVSVLRDVITFIKKHSSHPMSVIAQSTGSSIVMDYMLTELDPVFEKQVLLAPLIWPAKWNISVWLYLIVKPFMKTIPRHFSENSHDEMFLDFVKNQDPLQSRVLSLQWVGALKEWIAHFCLLPAKRDLKPLIIQGDDDQTVDWQKNIPQVTALLPDAKCIYLQGAGHHLANEQLDIRNKMLAAINLYMNQGRK